MASNDVKIRIGLTGQTETSAGLQRVARDVGAVGASADRAEKSSAALVSSLGRAAATLFGGLGAAAAAAQIAGMADAMTNLQSRLKLVSGSSIEVSLAQQQIIEIANRTRMSIDAVGEIYYKAAKGAEVLGLSQARVVSITETISKAMTLSGSSAESARAALVQFGQALQSGQLRGEELNSTMEQAPALAEAIAKGMGRTTGELRALAEAGKLTVPQLIAALEASKKLVDTQFSQMGTTIAQSFTVLGNSIQAYIGNVDRATGASRAFAGSVIFLADNIDRLVTGVMPALVVGLGAVIGRFIATGIAARAAAAQSVAAFSGMAAAVARLNLAGVGMPLWMGRVANGFRLIGGWPGVIATTLLAAIPAWIAWRDAATGATDAAADALAAAATRASRTGETDIEALKELRAEQQKLLDKRIDARFGSHANLTAAERQIQAKIDGYNAAIKEAEARDARLKAREGAYTPPLTTDQQSAARARIDAELAVEQAGVKRRLALAESEHALALIGDQQFIEEKRALALAEIAAQEQKQRKLAEIARQAKDTDAEAITATELQRLQQERLTVEAQFTTQRAEVERKAQADITKIEAAGLRERGDLVQAYAREWAAENGATIQRLVADGERGRAQLAAIMTEYATGAREAREQQAQADYGVAQERLAAIRSRLDAEVTIGAKTQAQAQAELRRETGALAQELGQKLVPQLQALIATSPTDADREKWAALLAEIDAMQRAAQENTWLDGIRRGLADYALEAADTFTNIKQAVESSLRGMEDAFVTFAQTGKLSFRELVDSIIGDLTRLLVQRSITGPLADAIGGALGGLGGGGATPTWGIGEGIPGTTPDVPNARGGVYRSPSLHAFANRVVNAPTLFAFAKGGVMGEAGPEAIMPLARDSSGRLGVHAEGGGGGAEVKVEVHNYSGATATTRETSDGRGGRRIEVMIGEMAAAEMRRPGSALHSSARSSFGLQPTMIGR